MKLPRAFGLTAFISAAAIGLAQSDPTGAAAPAAAAVDIPRPEPRRFASLNEMHAAYVTDFASKPGFGASRMMFLPQQDFLTHAGETYRFGTPDLIGLEGTPTAYHAPHNLITVADLSRKEARAHLRRRALSDGETLAVTELRQGKNLVTLPTMVPVLTPAGTDEVTGVLAVAPLRATAKCAECHQVPAGTPLGAFAYTLVPANNATNGLASSPTSGPIRLARAQDGHKPRNPGETPATLAQLGVHAQRSGRRPQNP